MLLNHRVSNGMDLTNPQDLQVALKLAGLRPYKGLGQHFLVDRGSLDTIVEAAELSHQDTVLEIGPGLGVMTNRLTQLAGKVVAVEADHNLAQLLRRDQAPNLEVVESDILDFHLTKLPSGYKVVANIPYYLTGNLLRLLTESPNPPQLMVLLIQKEVAQRINAAPGDMSVLAIGVQYYCQTEIVGMVERYKFWPAPKVDSAIIKITRRTKPAFEADPAKLFRLVKAGFGEKRKQLKNSLAGGLNVSSVAIESTLNSAKILPTARAQELNLEDWQKLYQEAMDRGWL